MAGEIGTIIDTQESQFGPGVNIPTKIGEGLFATTRYYNGAIMIFTYSCSAEGDVIGIDDYTFSAYAGGCTSIAHVSGDVYAFGFSAQYVGSGIKTIAINSSGIITHSIIATYLWYTSAPQFTSYEPRELVRINGNIFMTPTRHTGGGWWVYLKTISISDDGLTMSQLDQTYFEVLSYSCATHTFNISDNVMGLLAAVLGNTVFIKTYEVSVAGLITSVDSTTLDSTADGDYPKICHITGTVYAVAYRTTDASRLRTIRISATGEIGSIINTKDGLWGGGANTYDVYQLCPVPVGAILLSSGGAGGCQLRTIAVSNSGKIGSTIDTLAGVSGFHVFAIRAFSTSSIYAGYYLEGDYDGFIYSVIVATDNETGVHLSGLFVRGNEIQVVFSTNMNGGAYRSPDFGTTWYAMSGVCGSLGDVGFDADNPQNTFVGGDGIVFEFDYATSSGTYYLKDGAEVDGKVARVDVDINSSVAIFGTDSKVYKTLNWGDSVHELLDAPASVVAIGGLETVTSGVTLVVQPGTGGSCTDPGTGEFDYTRAQSVHLLAVAASGYTFSGWLGDINRIADVASNDTYILMLKDYTITPQFVGE